MDTEQKNTSGIAVSSSATTRLIGAWLVIARGVWLAIVIPSLALFVVSLPVYYQQLQTACVADTTCNLNGTLTAQGLQTLSTIGFSASGYAALITIFSAIIAAIWCGIGFILFWRRSDDWLALLAAFVLTMTGITVTNNSGYALAFASPALSLPLTLIGFLGTASIISFFVLFPNGRLIPQWMGLILLLGIINAFFDSFPSLASPFDANWPEWLYLLVHFVVAGAIIFSQIYRYRRVSTPVQRQQTKWVILGGMGGIGAYIGILAIGILNPSFVDTIWYNEVWSLIFPIAFLLIPLSIGFSILRYRLYDVDVLINRTLVYGMLTILLALVYVGLVIGLGSLVRLFTGQAGQSPIIIVASTLVIAALFQPLRHRIQAMIDRRFYRRKYDAAKVIESFSITLRHEVDLNQLREHLIEVVQDSMQPSHISLWLRESDRKPSSPDRMQS